MSYGYSRPPVPPPPPPPPPPSPEPVWHAVRSQFGSVLWGVVQVPLRPEAHVMYVDLLVLLDHKYPRHYGAEYTCRTSRCEYAWGTTQRDSANAPRIAQYEVVIRRRHGQNAQEVVGKSCGQSVNRAMAGMMDILRMGYVNPPQTMQPPVWH